MVVGKERKTLVKTYRPVQGTALITYAVHLSCTCMPLTFLFCLFSQHPDHYSRTKSIAEQKVLASRGREVHGGHTLHTCALRLAGVYGPGEQRHLPRIVVCITHSQKHSPDLVAVAVNMRQ